ncbi:MAG: hypothetical protein ACKO37_03690 [Vampirovibrionales bacterium]
MKPMHDFYQSLAKSHAAEDLPCWEEIYRNAFPSMVSFENHRYDMDRQRAGIDRTITLANGKQILVDEKARDRAYGNDILLEYISNSRTSAPGWVCKPLLCDYIAVAYIRSGHAFMLPVLQLQQAWERNKQDWLACYQIPPAVNRGYKTYNVAVPTDELFRAIGSQLRVRFTPTGSSPGPMHSPEPEPEPIKFIVAANGQLGFAF